MKADVRSRLEFDSRRRGEQEPAGAFKLGRPLRCALLLLMAATGTQREKK
ncbi:MAG: hypothetical protein QOJ04_4289, partial [Caballeronia sp.]|nr:hypothetical protein [Caballeronia sp.]